MGVRRAADSMAAPSSVADLEADSEVEASGVPEADTSAEADILEAAVQDVSSEWQKIHPSTIESAICLWYTDKVRRNCTTYRIDGGLLT